MLRCVAKDAVHIMRSMFHDLSHFRELIDCCFHATKITTLLDHASKSKNNTQQFLLAGNLLIDTFSEIMSEVVCLHPLSGNVGRDARDL